MWGSIRFTGYSWERDQRTEIRGRRTEDRKAEDGGALKSNQRITADLEALQQFAEFVAHKIYLFRVNDRVCHEFHIA